MPNEIGRHLVLAWNASKKSEVWAGVGCMFWGYLLWRYPAVVIHKPALQYMAMLLNDQFMVGFTLSLGFAQVISAAFDYKTARFCVAFLLSGFYVLLIQSFYLDPPLTPNVATCGFVPLGINICAAIRYTSYVLDRPIAALRRIVG